MLSIFGILIVVKSIMPSIFDILILIVAVLGTFGILIIVFLHDPEYSLYFDTYAGRN